ncbi:MAG: tRNA pseudouridine(38-40) synthase TruA, partial [Alphaproteobacteria bacterium]
RDNGPAIQQALEEAITAFCGETGLPIAAGRTDSGVHALGQVAHVDLARDWPLDTIRDAVNQHLKPRPIAVLQVEAVNDGFHARFDAIERRYRYLINTRRAPLALDRGRAWQVRSDLDAQAMHAAAQALVGKHDFTTFRDAECQAKSPIKTLDELSVGRDGDVIEITARARSFLHSQVRSIVGSLKYVGDGKWSAADLAGALEARDRAACGVIAPACGLYLVAVTYP